MIEVMTAIRYRLAKMFRATGEFLGPSPSFHGGSLACVALIDAKGRILSVNGDAAPAFFKAYGEASSFEMLFLPEERAAVGEALRSQTANQSTKLAPRAIARARAGDGAIRLYELTFEARAKDAIAVLILDRTEEERQALTWKKSADKARSDARSSASLLADLSHEMKTPLNAVIGFAEAIEAETFGPVGHDKYHEYAGDIRSSGRHLLDLVTSILDLARIEADRLSLTKSRADAGDLARECASMVRMAAEKAGLRVALDIPSDLPPCFLDARAVRQILINLLSNAVKFTSDGEVRLKVATSGDRIVFTVTDTGIGMSDVELTELGARFTQIHGLGVRGANGSGLGLSLAFALSELHGGNLKLSSAPGEGLTAVVSLPIGDVPARDNVRASAYDVDGVDLADDELPSRAAVLTQLERIEAYRREVAGQREDAA